MTDRNQATSVLIVGAGPTGLLLALALERASIPVMLVDSMAIETVADAGFDGRALALMYGSKRVFEGIGAWSALAPLVEPVWRVQVEDRGTGARVDYDARQIARHPFAYGVENRVLRRELLRLVRARAGIELRAPVQPVRLRRQGDGLTVELGDGTVLRPGLLVGADGRRSAVRELAGIAVERRSYRQTAITFAIRHQRSHGGAVRERLRAAGPLALLPLGPNLSSVTWTEGQAGAERLLGCTPERLLAALREQIGDELGDLALVGQPTGYPLSAHQAVRFVAPRIALAGDAAHGIHPIHAQGFNLAVRDVAVLAEILADTAKAGRDLGDAEGLMRYDRLRRADAGIVLNLTDGLNRLFSNDLEPAKLVRRVGLTALDRIPALKQLAMRRGMGIAGDLPKLARGETL